MFALERHKHILNSLKKDGAVWVSRLSAELDVTEETIRRDLEKLEKLEALIRTHGGAIPFDKSNNEMSLKNRKQLNTDAKEKLAKEAAKHIIPGDTVFLDASTTTFYIAKELKKIRNITVITNSIRIIDCLASLPNLKIIGVGGIVSDNQSFVGALAESSIINNYFANKIFFSSRGITENGILESNEKECAIKKCMMKNSSKKFYLCDKSKFNQVGFNKLAGFDEIDCIITEKEANQSFKNLFSENEIKVIEV